MWFQLDVKTSGILYLQYLWVGKIFYLFFGWGRGGKWASCLCLEANLNGEHSEKWNKSSYFKVVAKVSQLIELDCGYCVSLTSSLDLNKQNNFKRFPSNTKPNSWDVMLSASVHLYYISVFLMVVFFLWVCLTCKHVLWVYTVLCILDTLMWFQHVYLCGGVSHFGLSFVLLSSSRLHHRRPAVYVADRRPRANGRHRSATVWYQTRRYWLWELHQILFRNRYCHFIWHLFKQRVKMLIKESTSQY